MILGVGVDSPEIVLFAIHEISDRQHGRQHGMVLIVVPVSAHIEAESSIRLRAREPADFVAPFHHHSDSPACEFIGRR
jgi:hypothetical protein